MGTKSGMIGKRVEVATTAHGRTFVGIIEDKVNVPLASGSNDYVSYDHYVIRQINNGLVHVLAPHIITMVVRSEPKT